MTERFTLLRKMEKTFQNIELCAIWSSHHDYKKGDRHEQRT
nr:MAG TPA: hypothetical protein [Bacteriophage sp.]